MKVEALIIHLERATNRRPQAEAFAAKLPMRADLMRAVDARELSDAEMAAVYTPGLHRPRYPFPLRREEVACFLSHRKAWQTILDRGLDVGLVAEDDVDADEETLRKTVATMLAVTQPNDFVRLPVKPGEGGPVLVQARDIDIVEPRLRGLGMQVQLVGHEAARRLLEETRFFDRPVDTTIQLPGLTRARILSTRPAFVRHVDKELGGSVVQKKKKAFGEVLSREIKRFAYRGRIWLKARSSGA